MSDSLLRFLFEGTRIRGELVILETSFRSAVERHVYPDAVRALVGEAMAATALLGATVKFDGSLILQVQSGGPVHLLVGQMTGDRALRAVARWNGTVAAGSLPSLMGAGRLAITIDPGPEKERYQGVVTLEGESLAASIEAYFRQSEQLATRLWLAADGERAAGLLLQQLPDEDADEEAWSRVVHLASTITAPELLGLGGEDVLRRLFHEETVRVFQPEPLSFGCTCSRDTLSSVLRAFGHAEAEDILREHGTIQGTCEFCNQRYEFDAVDVAAMFSATPASGGPATRQ